MELSKSSETRSNSSSHKFRLPCQSRVDEHPDTSKWLEIRKRLSAESSVLQGLLLDNNRDIVVKYGKTNTITNEYIIANELEKHHIPNMIKYYCFFVYKDVLEHVGIKRHLCDPSGTEVGYLVMPYYSLGDLHKHPWKRETLHQLKNVLTQVSYAVLYAYETCGFVHNDLHLYNILLRKTKKKHIQYGNISLEIDVYYAIIMDFERSTMNIGNPRDVYHTIRDIINRAIGLENSDVMLGVDVSQLNIWMSDNTPITKEIYEKTKSVIDRITILYEKSKIPLNPF